MYKIIKNVIEMGNFELSKMLMRIDTIWMQGSISDEERAELIQLAQTGAKVEKSLKLDQKIAELDKRITALEALHSGSDDSTEEPENNEVIEATVPEYVVGKWYYAGDKVTFAGKTYICVAPEKSVCVWSPAEYPAYWDEVTE